MAEGYQENYPFILMYDYGLGPFDELYFKEKDIAANDRWAGIRDGTNNVNILVSFDPTQF